MTADQLRDLPTDPASGPPRPASLAAAVPGRPADPAEPDPRSPAWVRPALLLVLLGTALLYLWGLSASGWANAYYSAAAQAGSSSWKAFFFGSSDAASSITVDKTPASLWVMSLSVRIFGLSSWSVLVPQALAGVATVAVLFATVRRWFGPVAGLIAAAVMALTPVAVLMFRFNNPDALLVLVLVAGAYTTTRAIEQAVLSLRTTPARASTAAVAIVLSLTTVVTLAGPFGYAMATATRSYAGALPLAGPVVGQGGPGFGRPGSGNGAFPGPGNGSVGGSFANPAFPPGSFANPAFPPGPFANPAFPPGPFANPAFPPGAGTPSAALVQALTADAGSYTWVAAGIGSNIAAGLQLATREPVMPIGGFNGSDPSPTLTQFQAYVQDGRIHYFVASTGFRASSGSRSADQIASWVIQRYAPVSVGGVTLYDLTRGS